MRRFGAFLSRKRGALSSESAPSSSKGVQFAPNTKLGHGTIVVKTKEVRDVRLSKRRIFGKTKAELRFEVQLLHCSEDVEELCASAFGEEFVVEHLGSEELNNSVKLPLELETSRHRNLFLRLVLRDRDHKESHRALGTADMGLDHKAWQKTSVVELKAEDRVIASLKLRLKFCPLHDEDLSIANSELEEGATSSSLKVDTEATPVIPEEEDYEIESEGQTVEFQTGECEQREEEREAEEAENERRPAEGDGADPARSEAKVRPARRDEEQEGEEDGGTVEAKGEAGELRRVETDLKHRVNKETLEKELRAIGFDGATTVSKSMLAATLQSATIGLSVEDSGILMQSLPNGVGAEEDLVELEPLHRLLKAAATVSDFTPLSEASNVMSAEDKTGLEETAKDESVQAEIAAKEEEEDKVSGEYFPSKVDDSADEREGGESASQAVGDHSDRGVDATKRKATKEDISDLTGEPSAVERDDHGSSADESVTTGRESSIAKRGLSKADANENLHRTADSSSEEVRVDAATASSVSEQEMQNRKTKQRKIPSEETAVLILQTHVRAFLRGKRANEEDEIRRQFQEFEEERQRNDITGTVDFSRKSTFNFTDAPKADDLANDWRAIPPDDETKKLRRTKARTLRTRFDVTLSKANRVRPKLALRGATSDEQQELTATAFQSLWRGRLTRRQLKRQRNLATMCQAIVRGFLARRFCAKKRKELQQVTDHQRRLRERQKRRRSDEYELNRLRLEQRPDEKQLQREQLEQTLSHVPKPRAPRKVEVALPNHPHAGIIPNLPEGSLECYAALRAELKAAPTIEGRDTAIRLAELRNRVDTKAKDREMKELGGALRSSDVKSNEDSKRRSSRDNCKRIFENYRRSLSLLERRDQREEESEKAKTQRRDRLRSLEAAMHDLSKLSPLEDGCAPIRESINERIRREQSDDISEAEAKFLESFCSAPELQHRAKEAHDVAIQSFRSDRPWWAVPLPEDISCLPVDIRKVGGLKRARGWEKQSKEPPEELIPTEDEASMWWFAMARRDELDLLPYVQERGDAYERAPELKRLVPNTRAVGKLLYDRVAIGSCGVRVRTEHFVRAGERRTEARARAIVELARKRKEITDLPKELAAIRRDRETRRNHSATVIQKFVRGAQARRRLRRERSEKRVLSALANLMTELQDAEGSSFGVAQFSNALARFGSLSKEQMVDLEASKGPESVGAPTFETRGLALKPLDAKRARLLRLEPGSSWSARAAAKSESARSENSIGVRSAPVTSVKETFKRRSPQTEEPPQSAVLVEEASLNVEIGNGTDQGVVRQLLRETDYAREQTWIDPDDQQIVPDDIGADAATQPDGSTVKVSAPDASKHVKFREGDSASSSKSTAEQPEANAEPGNGGDVAGSNSLAEHHLPLSDVVCAQKLLERSPRETPRVASDISCDSRAQIMRSEANSRSGRSLSKKAKRRVEDVAQEIGGNLVIAMLRVLMRKMQGKKKVQRIFKDMLEGGRNTLGPRAVEEGIRRLQNEASARTLLYGNDLLAPAATTQTIVSCLDHDGDGVVSLDDFVLFAEESLCVPDASIASKRVKLHLSQRAQIARSSEEAVLLEAFSRSKAASLSSGDAEQSNTGSDYIGLVELRDGLAKLNVSLCPADLDSLFFAEPADESQHADPEQPLRIDFKDLASTMIPHTGLRSTVKRRAKTLIKRDMQQSQGNYFEKLMVAFKERDTKGMEQLSVRVFCHVVASSEIFGQMSRNEAVALAEKLQEMAGHQHDAKGVVKYELLRKLE